MRQCEKCKAMIEDNVKFCTSCGAPQPVNGDSQSPSSGMPQNPNSQQFGMNDQPLGSANSQPQVNETPFNSISPSPANMNGVTEQKKKSTVPIWVLFVVGGVAALIIIALIIILIVVSNSKVVKTETNVVTPTQTGQVEVPETTTTTGVSNTDGTLVKLGDQQVVVPAGMVYETTTNEGYPSLMLADGADMSTATWAAMIAYAKDISFTAVESQFDKIVQEAGKQYTVTNSGTETLGGVKYYYIDLSDGYTIAYAKAGLRSFVIQTFKTDFTPDTSHTVLDTIAPIVASATDATATRSLGNDFTIPKFNFNEQE